MKIGGLIPIRLGSERLPGKALKSIGGRPAVHHLLDRMFASRHLLPENVVVCTTHDVSDDPLVNVVESTGARVYRGSRDDIIERFHGAVSRYELDAVIQADGDDPFTDTEYMDRCMDLLLANPDLDVVSSRGLPIGLNSKAIRARAIRRVLDHRITKKNDHGFILLFTATDLCKTSEIQPISPDHVHATARLTLDYEDDLRFFNALHQAIGDSSPPFGVREIVATLRARPSLVDINAHLTEAYEERSAALLKLQYRRDGRVFDIETG